MLRIRDTTLNAERLGEIMIIRNGNVFCDDGVFRKSDIEIQADKITAIGENLQCNSEDVIDADGSYVVPGLVDIHIHGAMGADFCDATPESIEKIAGYLLTCGVTSFLGTTMTMPKDTLSDICKTACSFINASKPEQATLRGVHLEGPFISYDKRGAQNADHITAPDFEMLSKLNDDCGGGVRLVVIAPEVDGGVEFIKKAKDICTVSLAHSTAGYDTSERAFSSGASHVTHLYNGMNSLSHREPGIIGAAYDSSAYVELITDGVHIHGSVVRATFKLYGDDKVCLISDGMRACGLADGEYDLGGQMVTVRGKSATISNGALAGSVTNIADCMRQAVEFGIPLESALKAATINPAKSVGIDTQVGSLAVGKRADILVLDKSLQLRNVINGGINERKT